MKIDIILLWSLLLCSIGSQAQQKSSKSEGNRIALLSRELSVSPTKAKELTQALDYNLAAIRAAARNSSLTAIERQQQIIRLQAERKAKIAAVLTAEQLRVLAAHQQPLLDAKRREREQKIKEQHQKLNEKSRTGRDSVQGNPLPNR